MNAHELGERAREDLRHTPTLRSRNERLRRGETHEELARAREDKARAVEEVKHNAMSLMHEVMGKVRADERHHVQLRVFEHSLLCPQLKAESAAKQEAEDALHEALNKNARSHTGPRRTRTVCLFTHRHLSLPRQAGRCFTCGVSLRGAPAPTEAEGAVNSVEWLQQDNERQRERVAQLEMTLKNLSRGFEAR